MYALALLGALLMLAAFMMERGKRQRARAS
jgi:hypothetical protein